MAKEYDSRQMALEILLKTEEGTFVHTALKEALDACPAAGRNEKAFVKRLVTGTVSARLQLDAILRRFVNKDPAKLKTKARLILETGLYQILYMDAVPDRAVCNEAVRLAAQNGVGYFKGFVNGTLRNLCRNRASLLDFSDVADPLEKLSLRYAMPLWLVRMWEAAYGEEKTLKMLQAFLQESKTTVRVNTAKTDTAACGRLLNEEHISFTVHPYCPEALVLQSTGNISGLSSFQRGWYQVQDASSILAGDVAGIRPGDRILDLCAAPGGKAMHAAARTGERGSVIACDLTEKKTALIEENARRLGLPQVQVQVRDACVFVPAFEAGFDLVIADLPCSGLGVIGRKSDIKYRVREEDIEALAKLQRQMLSNALRYVRPGGTLVFSTCTVNQKENDENFRWLASQQGLQAVGFSRLLCEALQKEPGVNEGFLQLFPGTHDCDGFFISKFRKDG